MVDTLRYWCDGSVDKALELVLASMKHLGLRDRVVDALGLKQNETHAYIVERIKAAVAELKHCRSEEQRQQYRIILTAVAPEPGRRMGKRVADVVGARRDRAHFRKSRAKRAAIDASIKANQKPLAVGDTVLCRHGQGTLKVYAGPSAPCTVEIVHGCRVRIR